MPSAPIFFALLPGLFPPVAAALPHRPDCPASEQVSTPGEFLDAGYVGLRHVAIAVADPPLAARFAIDALGLCPGPQTEDFRASNMQWVTGPSRTTSPFKLHFIPNARSASGESRSYVDALNAMTTLIEGSLAPWAQWMDNHLCIGYHDATDLISRIVSNEVSEDFLRWYASNVPGNGGTVPWVGPVARRDGVYQFYVMMPFGHLVELQQPAAVYEAARASGRAGLPAPTTWDKVRPAFTTQGQSGDIATRSVLVRWGHPAANATSVELTLQGSVEAPLPSNYVPETQRHLFAPGGAEARLRLLEAELRAAVACAGAALLAATALATALCRRSAREVAVTPALLV